jgi:hypothetical protein
MAILGIDHLVIAVPDPDAAASGLEEALGLAFTGGGRHAAAGTWNRLAFLGDSYIELIGVFDRALAARSWIGAPTVRALDAIAGGPGTRERAATGGLATWAVATDAIDADVALLRARGSDVADPIGGERTLGDGRVVRWRLAAPRRLGPTDPPFLIEHDLAGAEWTPDERAARAMALHPIGGPVRLEVLEIPVADPHRVSLRFMAGAGIGPFRPSLAGRGSRDAVIGAQTLRLRPDPRGEALPTIRLRVFGSPAEVARDVELLGCRWIVRPD